MRKTVTYSGFALATVLVAVVFVTSKSYTQLGVAVVLYPLLVYFAYRLFLDSPNSITLPSIHSPFKIEHVPASSESSSSHAHTNKAHMEVVDIDKRVFLKLIGATGISYLLFSLLGRRIETSFLGTRVPALGDSPLAPTTTSANSPLDGYRISEVSNESDATYYGFVNQGGAWLIMKEDVQNNNFRYIKGDSDFAASWNLRDSLKYYYFYELFNK